MKIINLTCGHKISVKTWPSKAGLAKVRHHYKKFHPARMKKMTRKSLATKRKRGLINQYQVKMGAGRGPYTVTFRTKKEVDKYLGKAKKHHPYFRVLGTKKVGRRKGLVRNRCNPKRKVKRNPVHKPVVIYDKLLKMSAYRDGTFPKGHRGHFKHDFKHDTDARILGMPDGSLRIVSKRGKPLWKEINY
jgi:hypothetical protein